MYRDQCDTYFILKQLAWVSFLTAYTNTSKEDIMSDVKISLSTWIKKQKNNEFIKKDVDTMIDAGWHDWFCKDSALYSRLKRMIGMVKAAAASELVDADNTYVFFKNNCPCSGGTYDSFSICDLNGSQDVIFWVTAKCGHSDEAVIIKAPNFGNESNLLTPNGNANDIKKFFKDTKPADLLVLEEIATKAAEARLAELTATR
jgi:hypothetical protein